MRAPKPEIMFERLLTVLRLEKSVFVPAGRPPYGRLIKPAHMTRGLTLEINRPGDGYSRIQVSTYDGNGSGCGQILYSCGAKEFAEKVWAIEAGIEAARALGVKVGEL